MTRAGTVDEERNIISCANISGMYHTKMAGWTGFAKHRDIFKGNIGTCLKRQVYNSCAHPGMAYGTDHPSKEHASSRTNKDGNESVKHHISGQKYKHLGKRKDHGHRRD